MADVIARITLYPAHQSGLLEKIGKGFRCPLKWDTETRDNKVNLVSFEFKLGEEHSAGESFNVGLWFLSRNSLEEKLWKGANFKLWSSGLIGEGEVIEVLYGKREPGKNYLDDDKSRLY